MVDLGREGLTTASVGKGGWVDEAAEGGKQASSVPGWSGSQGAVCREEGSL